MVSNTRVSVPRLNSFFKPVPLSCHNIIPHFALLLRFFYKLLFLFSKTCERCTNKVSASQNKVCAMLWTKGYGGWLSIGHDEKFGYLVTELFFTLKFKLIVLTALFFNKLFSLLFLFLSASDIRAEWSLHLSFFPLFSRSAPLFCLLYKADMGECWWHFLEWTKRETERKMLSQFNPHFYENWLICMHKHTDTQRPTVEEASALTVGWRGVLTAWCWLVCQKGRRALVVDASRVVPNTSLAARSW